MQLWRNVLPKGDGQPHHRPPGAPGKFGIFALLLGGVALCLSAVALGHRLLRPPRKSTSATVVQTTANLSDALRVKAPLLFTSSPARGARVIDVDSSSRYQRMLGFGAAMTDSSAWLLHHELTPKQKASTMKALFSPSGIDLNYVRIPIGASDYVADVDP